MLLVDLFLSIASFARPSLAPRGVLFAWQTLYKIPSIVVGLKYCQTQLFLLASWLAELLGGGNASMPEMESLSTSSMVRLDFIFEILEIDMRGGKRAVYAVEIL
jgi:hypothetical protein